jgi:hypothetical protein
VEVAFMRELASEYPGWFSGLVFGTTAFLCSLVVAAFYVLILRSDGTIVSGSGAPFDAYLFLYILLLPGLVTGVIGVLLGRKLLGDSPLRSVQAAGFGAGIAAISAVLWAAVGELLWLLIDFPTPNPADSGVVGFLAVLGYALMGVVLLVVVGLGAVVGVGLRSWWGR